MLKVGVIGVGLMGRNHARIYSEMGCLSGIYDAYADTANSVANRFGTTAYNSIESLLTDVDAVSICTPTTYHFETAKRAIELGKALLVEKPFTGDTDKARELCELAEKQGVTLASGFVERFNPIVQATRDTIDAGKLGDIISINARRVSSFPDRIRDVGVVKDLAIHDIDVLRYITGSEVKTVYALGGSMRCAQYEDHANLLMTLGDSIQATVEVNWLTPRKVRELSITSSQGFAVIDYIEQGVRFSTSSSRVIDESDLSRMQMELATHEVNVKKEEPLKRELEAFLNAANMSTKASVDGWDALANLKVCEGALRSLAECRPIEIN